MDRKVEELEKIISDCKKKYEEDSHNVKDYIEALNELAEVFIKKEDWQKAITILNEGVEHFPNAYRVLSTGLYRRVGVIFAINYYFVSLKLGVESNISKFDEMKELMNAAELEDISTSQDIRTAEDANILNRIELYKKHYKTNDSSTQTDKEKEKIFKEFFWTDEYKNYKFSWEK